MSEAILYDRPGPYFAANFPGPEPATTRILFEHTEQGFRVRPDWASYNTGVSQPDRATVDSYAVPVPEPEPVTVIDTIITGYAESEAARSDRIKLLKSTASYALGAKIGGDLAAANPPTNAEELAAIKAEAKAQASALGGVFFDAYFNWIGAYREGGGPGFLAAVRADNTTEFLAWPTPANGITLPDGTVVLPEGGFVGDLFEHFLT